jgi:CBS domain-containing protein
MPRLTAGDVMTPRPVTVSPDTSVTDIARVLLGRAISAVPVLDGERLVGIVSEGDLMRRAETGTERRRPWWLGLLTSPETLAAEYTRAHGRRAADVMTTKVITVTETTPLAKIAKLLEDRRIKRVPVVRNGKVVGIVSRADLLRVLAAAPDQGPPRTVSDQEIRARFLRDLEAAAWATPTYVNPIVVGGVVQLWGLVGSEQERRALRAMAARIGGVRGVEDHLRRGT